MANYRNIKIAKTAAVSKQSVLLGDITLKDYTTIFPMAVLRGDDSYIIIGEHSNVQENCTIHCSKGNPTMVGDYVTIGHNAVLHGCQIGDNTIIGMGSIIMDGTKIGKNCLVAAGSLIASNKEFPDGCLIMGSPARVKRQLTEEEIAENHNSANMCEQDGIDMMEQGIIPRQE